MKRISFLGLILCLSGCDGGGGNTDAGMVDTDSGMVETDAGMNDTDAGMMTTGDGNNTFTSADPIEVDGAAATAGVIATDGDVDFYTFEATAGDWISINTDANPDDDPMAIDTVITLYDENMTQIAENDDAQPRASTDSEIVILIPTTGTYYVEVQEFSSWAMEPLESDPSYMYDLSVTTLAAGGAINVDAEMGNTAADAQTLASAAAGTGRIAFILGELDSATDVDVYSFTIPAGEPRNFSVNLMPVGPDGYGSTVMPAHMWVTDSTGATIIGRIAPNGDFLSVEPSLPENPDPGYLLFVEHGGTAGANDFYVIKAFTTADNPLEDATMELTNDLQAGAMPLTFADNGAGGRSGFILAHLTTGDTDHFNTVMVNAGEQLSVTCGSLTLGSGLMGLSIAVLNPDGTVLAMDNESATHAPLIEDRPVTAGNVYTLRMTATGQDSEVTGNWVRCGVHLAVPMTP